MKYNELIVERNSRPTRASKTAIEMIKKAGGNFTKAKVPARPKAENKVSE